MIPLIAIICVHVSTKIFILRFLKSYFYLTFLVLADVSIRWAGKKKKGYDAINNLEHTEYVTLFKHVKSLPYFCSAIFAAHVQHLKARGQWMMYWATLNHDLWCMAAINGVSQRIKLSMSLHRSNMVRLAPKRLHFLKNWSGYDNGWYQGGGLDMMGTNMVIAIVSIFMMVAVIGGYGCKWSG